MITTLYHGTSRRSWPSIQKHGIRPRKPGAPGNWKLTSGAGRVYLSDCWALYYASAAAKGKLDLAVVRIDATKLSALNLVPDEDWVYEQYRLSNEEAFETMSVTDRRKVSLQLRDFARAHPDLAHTCLEMHGTIAHVGVVPATAINAVAFVKWDAYCRLIFEGHDPVVGQIPHSILGNKYRGWMQWLFGEDPEIEWLGGKYKFPQDRSGIEVLELQSSY